MALHAITGCDTVSAIYRRGKRNPFNMVHKKEDYTCWLRSQNYKTMHEEVQKAGESFILKLYKAGNTDSPNKHHYIANKRAIGRSSLSSSFDLATPP